MNISAVIFDFGGVISSPLFVGLGTFEETEGFARGSLLQLMFGETHYIGVEGRAVAEAIAQDPDAVESEHEVADEPDWHLLEKGQLDMTSYFQRVVDKAPRVLGRPLDPDAFGRFWQTTAPGVHWMVVHKMRDLKSAGVHIGLLTNNVKEFGESWRAMFPIDELCEVVVDSSHVGMRKPERAIYELTCERMRVTPDETVFVDDNVDNVEAARAFGMATVHFLDPVSAIAELDAMLERRGVKRR